MKVLMSAGVVMVLSLAIAAWGQNSSQSNNNQNSNPNTQSTQGNTTSSQGQSMSGTVSKNGQTFVNDQDNKSYKVDNPQVDQSYQGQHVTMMVRVDPDTNTIHIVQIETPQPSQQPQQ